MAERKPAKKSTQKSTKRTAATGRRPRGSRPRNEPR